MTRSARRRHLREKKRKKDKYSNGLVKFLAPLLIILVSFLFVNLTTKNWNDNSKFILTYPEDSLDVTVLVLDPNLDEIVSITIPGDTEVEVARNYGTFRIKNVWKLGKDEKVDGDLLAETITKNFSFPVYLWSTTDAISLKTGNVKALLKFIFSPEKSNIPFGDRLHAAYFSLQIGDIDRTEIELGKNQYLQKVKLNDGEGGYRLNGPISQRLTIYFANNLISERAINGDSLRVAIVDAGAGDRYSSTVAQIIEVLGAKVVSIERNASAEIDCEIRGVDKAVSELTSKIFGCKILSESTDFDLEVKLGSNFNKVF